MTKSLWINLTLILLCKMMSLGAASLSVKVSPQNPSEGETISYSATLTGAKPNSQIRVNAYPKCQGWTNINWSNPNTSRSMSFDSRTGQKVSLTFTWQGQAKSKGSYPITPLVLEVEGKRLTSKALTLNVTPLQTDNFFLFNTSLSAKEAYVGQSVDLHLDLLMSDKEIQKYERYLGQNYELASRHYDAMDLKGPWTESFHIVPKQVRQAQGANLYFGVKAQNIKVGEYFYRRHRLTFTLEPKKAGNFVIPAIQQLFYQLTFRRAFIGVDAQRVSRPIVTNSQALKLNVVEPPSKDRPASFMGQVCQNLKAELLIPDLTPGQQVQMHAPIPLQLKVSGSIAPGSIRAPNWSAQKDLLKGFDVSSQSMVREDESKHTLFSEIVIRPKNADLKEVPAIEFSYFDPIKKSYQKVLTKSFPITVQAVDQSAGLDEQPLALLELKKETKKTKTIGRIEGIEINQSKLMQSTQKTWSWPLILILSYLPILGVSLYYGMNSLKHLQAEKSHAQRYQASGTIKSLEAAENSSAILEAINRYINQKWKVTDPRKANLNADSKNSLDQLLAELEAASYAPDGGNQSSLKSHAIDLVKQLDKEVV